MEIRELQFVAISAFYEMVISETKDLTEAIVFGRIDEN